MRVTHDEDTPCSNSTSVTTFLQPLYCTFLYSGPHVQLNCSHKSRRRNRPRRRNRRKTRTKGDLIPSSQRTCVEPTFMLRKVADGGLAEVGEIVPLLPGGHRQEGG